MSMDLKKTNAPVNTITYDRNQIDEPTENIYEAISIISRRAEQINSEIKKELIDKLETEFDEVPKGSIKPDSKFEMIEDWGSMHSLILIALADTDYDVVITGEDLMKINTVQDLFNLLLERQP